VPAAEIGNNYQLGWEKPHLNYFPITEAKKITDLSWFFFHCQHKRIAKLQCDMLIYTLELFSNEYMSLIFGYYSGCSD
jgi:hypothetical protein